MQISKQIEILNKLRAKLIDNKIIINAYGDTWLLCENKNYSNRFIYIELGDWVRPHTATIYNKINCFERKQLSYNIELSEGENIEPLISFVLNPSDGTYVKSNDVKNQRIYLTELYGSIDNKTKLQHLKESLDDQQQMIMKNLQHIHMLNKDQIWHKSLDQREATVLRFDDGLNYFDYDCTTQTIIDTHIEKEYIQPPAETTKKEDNLFTFLIPVEWVAAGVVPIKAKSFKDALRISIETLDDLPIPDDSKYIDGSYRISSMDDVGDDLDELVEILTELGYGKAGGK